MAAEPVITPMAVCESCYLETHTKWEPESMDAKGKILMRLTGIDVPEKVNNGNVEVCVVCGGLTVAGIFELKLTSEVYFFENQDFSSLEVEIDSEED